MTVFKANEALTILDASAVTTAFDGCVSAGFDCRPYGEVSILIAVVKADATSLELRPELMDHLGLWYAAWRVTAGTGAPDEVTLPLATLAATDFFTMALSVRGAVAARVKFKKTGGSGSVLVAAKMTGGGP